MECAYQKRMCTSDAGTYSTIIKDNVPICVAMEPPWKNNQEYVSCIPAGAYLCKPYSSEKYPYVYEI